MIHSESVQRDHRNDLGFFLLPARQEPPRYIYTLNMRYPAQSQAAPHDEAHAVARLPDDDLGWQWILDERFECGAELHDALSIIIGPPAQSG